MRHARQHDGFETRIGDLDDHYSWQQVYRLNGIDPRVNRGDSS